MTNPMQYYTRTLNVGRGLISLSSRLAPTVKLMAFRTAAGKEAYYKKKLERLIEEIKADYKRAGAEFCDDDCRFTLRMTLITLLGE